MKLFIAIDREGISGVVAERDADREGPAAKAAMRLMRGDLDAVLSGCDAAGGGEVVVCDAHDDGRSLASEGLPAGVTLVGGSPAPYSMMQGIGAGYDGALFVGYHARAGAAEAVLEHTWNYKVFSVMVGDLEVGEFGIGALLAGHFGVPAVYASGDDKLAAEAQALVPGIVTTVVKRGLSRHAAELLPPNETQAHDQGGRDARAAGAAQAGAARLERRAHAAHVHARGVLRPGGVLPRSSPPRRAHGGDLRRDLRRGLSRLPRLPHAVRADGMMHVAAAPPARAAGSCGYARRVVNYLSRADVV